MEKLLKYMILAIASVAVFIGLNRAHSVEAEVSAETFSHIESVTCHSIVSSSDSDVCIPLEEPNANPSRHQTNTRKSNNIHQHNFECVKSGKILDAGIIYFNQMHSVHDHSSLYQPDQLLVSFGKYLI